MDHSLVALIRSGKDSNVSDFFRLLSLCHTVMVEHKDGDHKPHADKQEVKWPPPQLTSYFFFFPTVRQASWCTRLLRLMRAPWWRQPGTLALSFCHARRTPSPSRKWAKRPPTGCWRCSTSTPTASGCPLSVRTCAHLSHPRVTEREKFRKWQRSLKVQRVILWDFGEETATPSGCNFNGTILPKSPPVDSPVNYGGSRIIHLLLHCSLCWHKCSPWSWNMLIVLTRLP